MASAEPLFEAKKDAWFDLDLEDAKVHLRKRPFVRRGEIANWLTSEAFDLREARSAEAEAALTKARALTQQGRPSRKKLDAVDQALRKVLPDVDPFWLQWTYFREQHHRSRRREDGK